MNEKLKEIIEIFIESGMSVDGAINSLPAVQLEDLSKLLMDEVVRLEMNRREEQEKLFSKSTWSKDGE